MSPSTQRVGGMQSTVRILRSIGHPKVLRIGSNSRTQSRLPNIPFLISRFKKLLTKNGVYRNS